jgi:DNA processing protein
LPLRFVEIGDEGYPARLLDLPRPPKRLWWQGDLDLLNGVVVAVVGTRRATSYGRRMTTEIAGGLAKAGVTVVSGMALGIDAVAHRAALDATGATVAVLGTGADVAYPRAHVALHTEIVERGAVLSELPPGAHSHRGSFPERNRMIAALASATIVIEAPFDSGALITATRALELGRDVAIVPGQIDSPHSQGSNALLRDGAHPIVAVADALALVGLAPPPVPSAPRLEGDSELRIWRALDDGGATMDELCARTGLPVTQCLTTVTALELRGLIECALTGEIRRF